MRTVIFLSVGNANSSRFVDPETLPSSICCSTVCLLHILCFVAGPLSAGCLDFAPKVPYMEPYMYWRPVAAISLTTIGGGLLSESFHRLILSKL